MLLSALSPTNLNYICITYNTVHTSNELAVSASLLKCPAPASFDITRTTQSSNALGTTFYRTSYIYNFTAVPCVPIVAGYWKFQKRYRYIWYSVLEKTLAVRSHACHARIYIYFVTGARDPNDNSKDCIQQQHDTLSIMSHMLSPKDCTHIFLYTWIFANITLLSVSHISDTLLTNT